MAKSSTVPLSPGSPYWDLPIQFWVVAPMLDGRRVMFGFVPTAVPLTYNVPVLPDSVTARWIHAPVGSWPAVVGLIRCSLPPPEVVSAKRGPVPALTVRNMFVFGPEPKSNTRDHWVVAARLTHVATVKSFRVLTIPAGIVTLWFGLAPLRPIALPKPP